jgi:hypothetical protein
MALVVGGTGSDQERPVELDRDGDGRAAARMCFTNHVDQLDGSWDLVGDMILSGSVAAEDPRCGQPARDRHDDTHAGVQ